MSITRYFNTVELEKDASTITKSSREKKQKIVDEIYWYANIPEELKVFTPKIISVSPNTDPASYTLEYIEGFTFDRYILSMPLIKSKAAMDLVLATMSSIHRIHPKRTTRMYTEYYKAYTQDRINTLFMQDAYWKHISQKKHLIINGTQYLNPLAHLDLLYEKIENITENNRSCIIHGDYHLSNIIISSSNGIKLIDPRGRFFNRSIYGDDRYDIAKLKHSLEGRYDLIVQKKYLLTFNGNEYTFRSEKNSSYDSLNKQLDKFIQENNYELRDLIILETLLFLGMIPLHKESRMKQLAFLLTAAKLFKKC